MSAVLALLFPEAWCGRGRCAGEGVTLLPPTETPRFPSPSEYVAVTRAGSFDLRGEPDEPDELIDLERLLGRMIISVPSLP